MSKEDISRIIRNYAGKIPEKNLRKAEEMANDRNLTPEQTEQFLKNTYEQYKSPEPKKIEEAEAVEEPNIPCLNDLLTNDEKTELDEQNGQSKPSALITNGRTPIKPEGPVTEKPKEQPKSLTEKMATAAAKEAKIIETRVHGKALVIIQELIKRGEILTPKNVVSIVKEELKKVNVPTKEEIARQITEERPKVEDLISKINIGDLAKQTSQTVIGKVKPLVEQITATEVKKLTQDYVTSEQVSQGLQRITDGLNKKIKDLNEKVEQNPTLGSQEVQDAKTYFEKALNTIQSLYEKIKKEKEGVNDTARAQGNNYQKELIYALDQVRDKGKTILTNLEQRIEDGEKEIDIKSQRLESNIKDTKNELDSRADELNKILNDAKKRINATVSEVNQYAAEAKTASRNASAEISRSKGRMAHAYSKHPILTTIAAGLIALGTIAYPVKLATNYIFGPQKTEIKKGFDWDNNGKPDFAEVNHYRLGIEKPVRGICDNGDTFEGERFKKLYNRQKNTIIANE